MEDKEKELLVEFSKVLALGLGVLAWHLLESKSRNYRVGVMKQIEDAILMGKF